ncbi:hypothetical protein CQ14_13145 [Bradyrhizobium lablabi]|uniref:Translation initiation factor IF-2 n=1 Tax=Bradyrhizobium lablabi TaxID=722472 RepID=A0A0R3MJ36_9BRAD|nr:hypothetical protein [Bradyrhizobium lablabi]KRR17315.1 hypothetical protein CQ14_13145 [Bradyrhizobium lablabi]
MRKFIFIAGFVFVSAAAQAGDRSLSLGGVEQARAPAPAKAIVDGPRTAEVPQQPEPPKYIERPAIEPKAETTKAETTKPDTPKAETYRGETARPRAARAYRPAAASAHAGPTRPAFRPTASMSGRMHRARYSIQARIIHALHRHGIYW